MREGYGLHKASRSRVEMHAAPERVRWQLAERVSRALTEEAVAGSAARITRVPVPVEEIEPFSWLRTQPGPRLYWSGREDGVRVAAAGVADVQEGGAREGTATLRKRFGKLGPGDTAVRYYGGLRFDPYREPGEEWAAFGAYRFVLPRFELRVRDGRATLACNLVLPRDVERREEILKQVEEMRPARAARATELPRPLHREDRPGWTGWRCNIERALAAFTGGDMEKVVLARRAEFKFGESPDPLTLAASLESATPGCFHFLFETLDGDAFVGASPERLYRREGRRIKSEAVAGTRPRGESETEDARLREELMGSAKDRHEQNFVRESIREALSPLCEELEIEEDVSEMALATRRHLVSRVRGTLRADITDAEVLEALHPTPAVGGHPQAEALAEIRRAEPFDRGWYAGPVGWVGPDAAEFAVGIRSGLVRGRSLALYSGAGIVPGSTPEGEWAEIEQKIDDFTRILGIEPGSLHAAS